MYLNDTDTINVINIVRLKALNMNIRKTVNTRIYLSTAKQCTKRNRTHYHTVFHPIVVHFVNLYISSNYEFLF